MTHSFSVLPVGTVDGAHHAECSCGTFQTFVVAGSATEAILLANKAHKR